MSPPSTANAHPLSELTIALARNGAACLDKPNALTEETVVHELRVATKRLRAAWHLVKDQAPAGLCKERRAALGALSAKLSGARDLSVLLGLAQHLAASQADGRLAMALDQVVADLVRQHEEVVSSGIHSGELVEELRGDLASEIAAWEIIDHGDPQALRRSIRHELRRSLKRARRDTREALRSLDAELWHDWRKTVKRLRYQREFVAAMQDRRPGKFDARVSRLGSRLGERNDLANLALCADALGKSGDLSPEQLGLVRKAIAAAEKGIIGNCRRLGRVTLLK